MKLFLSWSTEESHLLAQALADWVPSVVQSIEPFLSSEDIQKGALWFTELGNELEATDFGILCLTPYNREAPWILFEAGALSKKLSTTRVVPLLVEVSPADIKPPLSHFNLAQANEGEIKKIVQTLNANLGEARLSEARLGSAFTKWWPDLEKKLEEVHAALQARAAKQVVPPGRDLSDKIDELLDLSRSVARQIQQVVQDPRDDWINWPQGGSKTIHVPAGVLTLSTPPVGPGGTLHFDEGEYLPHIVAARAAARHGMAVFNSPPREAAPNVKEFGEMPPSEVAPE